MTTDYPLSGPYTHGNLALFLIHGPATDDRDFLTLDEALATGQALLHETENVGRLEIENLSKDCDLFIQAGDVVKGGKQDRTLPYDTVVPAASGRVPVNSFCVEQGRWSGRRGESERVFRESSFCLSTNELKHAAYASPIASQEAVWLNVAGTQTRLEQKLGAKVRSGDSATSLQLTLESPALSDALKPYLASLRPTPEGRADAIGVVAAVDGRVVSADVYASPRLFRKLWPKLLQGYAVEAVLGDGHVAETVTEAIARSFLADAERGTEVTDARTERTSVRTRQSDTTIQIDSCDVSQCNVVLHRSALSRLEGEFPFA
jgi:hypothetical protein